MPERIKSVIKILEEEQQSINSNIFVNEFHNLFLNIKFSKIFSSAWAGKNYNISLNNLI